MPEWLIVALGVVAGFVLVWGALIAVLWWQQRRSGGDVDWRAVLRLAPDVIRLVRRLAVDPAVPRRCGKRHPASPRRGATPRCARC